MMRESTMVDIQVDSRINLDGKVNVADLKIFITSFSIRQRVGQ